MINFIHSDCLDVEKIDNVGLIITDPPYYVIPNGKNTTKGKDNFTWDSFKDLDDFLINQTTIKFIKNFNSFSCFIVLL